MKIQYRNASIVMLRFLSIKRNSKDTRPLNELYKINQNGELYVVVQN